MLTKARVLFWLGMLCFLPFFIPMLRHDDIPNGTEDIFTLGLPASPWLEHHRTETTVETDTKNEKTGGFSQSSTWKIEQKTTVHWFAWSWLFVIAGVTALAVSRRMKESAALKDPKQGTGNGPDSNEPSQGKDARVSE